MALDANIASRLAVAYPRGLLEFPDTADFDIHLPPSGIQGVVEVLKAGIAASVFLPRGGVHDIAYHIFLGPSGLPDWGTFNHILTGDQRRQLLDTQPQLAYWILLVSRVAPVWTGHWNGYLVRSDGVWPDIIREPPLLPWPNVTTLTREFLAAMNLRELSSVELDQPVPFLSSTAAEPAVSTGSSAAPTLYMALFEPFV